MQYPASIGKLVNILKKLPGVGRRTAERYAFDLLLGWSEKEVDDLQKTLEIMHSSVRQCSTCGSLSEEELCSFCHDEGRKKETLCIVSSPKDIFMIEQTQEFTGMYHVLPGLLSPLDGRGVAFLGLDKLQNRLEKERVKEMILALDSSLEGDATCLFIKEHFQNQDLIISRLAFGIPVGSSLEYVDRGTLARAFHGRSSA